MNRPGVCFVGPMVGRNPGYVITAGERLSCFFTKAGYQVTVVSTFRNRYARFIDILHTLINQSHSYDIVIIDTYSGPSFVVEDVCSFVTKMLGKNLILALHGGNFPVFAGRFPQWIRRVLKRADAIVTPSNFLARTAQKYGFDTVIIPNVIDVNAYPFRLRSHVRPRLFWMRSFHPIWNPEMALHVLSRLKSWFPDATLVMGGQDKGMLNCVKEMAKRLQLNENVRFAGFLDMQGKIREADQSDIFINTNRIDNMPIALIEAAAFGMPIVSTNVGGIPDILKHEETGMLVEDNDAEGMASAIRSLVDSPDMSGRLSLNGRKQAESSSWERVRPQWEALLDRVSR